MSSLEQQPPGARYWRSLGELARDPQWRREVLRSLAAHGVPPHLSRRQFVRLMSASLALAGLTLSGCRRWPRRVLAPRAANPEGRVPGRFEHYATVMEIGGVGAGLLVTAFEGRPLKIEGNPLHPSSRSAAPSIGAADVFAQAATLELYDPRRSRAVIDRRSGQPRRSTWEQFAAFAREHFASVRAAGGEGFAVLSEASSGPGMQDMKERLRQTMPACRWYEYEPLTRDNEREGMRLAFGKPLRLLLHLDRADVIVAFDEDLFGDHPCRLRHAADWSLRRDTDAPGTVANRLYVAESRLTITGAAADSRLPLRPSRVGQLVVALAARLGLAVAPPDGLSADEKAFIESAGADLLAHRGRAVVAIGAHHRPDVHALVHAINAVLDSPGNTLAYIEDPLPDRPSHLESIIALAGEMRSGKVRTLLILGGNPAYDVPADLDFPRLLETVPATMRLGLYEDETSALCKWHLPRAHWLESWADSRAADGTIAVAQPLIEPLFGGRSAIEILAMVIDDAQPDGLEIIRRAVLPMLPSGAGQDREKLWRKALHDGLVEGSAARPATVSAAPARQPASEPVAADAMEIRFLPDARVYDGRFANNAWLQELPDPLTKLTWDNAALFSVSDAAKLGIRTGDLVRISLGARSIEIAAYVLPGQPAGVIGLPLGYGRRRAGDIGNGVGFDTYVLRTTGGFYWASGATVQKTGRTYPLASTQDHHLIDPVGFAGRRARIGAKSSSAPLIREVTAGAEEHAHPADHHDHTRQPFDPPHPLNENHAWAMVIDLSRCIGCSACTIACQAENNIPVVGKDQVLFSREMHWLRIDRYFRGEPDDPNPQVVFQPVTCQHCENAPCEQVCPVAATVHDTEGLNAMVYNRCVGTRYCSNNCPFKVRRFNYLDYYSKHPRRPARPWLGMPDSQQGASVDPVLRMVFNPSVSVRMRGVMEKCTFCVQRIRQAQAESRRTGRPLRDGDVVPACQQTCPTQAIVFGDLNDPSSRVSALRRSGRAYTLLEELNIRPRTAYLARLRNPPGAAPARHAPGDGKPAQRHD